MPNKWTFKIKPIKELLFRIVGNGMLMNGEWCDPFAGYNSQAQVTNDLDTKTPTTFHLDALEFLRQQDSGKYDGVLYDPPYSFTQARKYGNKDFSKQDYWMKVKNEVARIIKPGGKAICFGWNSNGLGKGRKFKLEEVLIVAHGGSKNDTIVTVETKLNP